MQTMPPQFIEELRRECHVYQVGNQFTTIVTGDRYLQYLIGFNVE
jgi:hypothetical protein